MIAGVIKSQIQHMRQTYILAGLKRAGMGVGTNLNWEGDCYVMRPAKITIGNNCSICRNVSLIATFGKIVIGDNVNLSSGVTLQTGGFDIEKYMQGERRHMHNQDIYIHDNAWICYNALILPGVRITGNNVIVAAGAVVVNDICEDNVLVGGVPAKIIKRYPVFENRSREEV